VGGEERRREKRREEEEGGRREGKRCGAESGMSRALMSIACV